MIKGLAIQIVQSVNRTNPNSDSYGFRPHREQKLLDPLETLNYTDCQKNWEKRKRSHQRYYKLFSTFTLLVNITTDVKLGFSRVATLYTVPMPIYVLKKTINGFQ